MSDGCISWPVFLLNQSLSRFEINFFFKFNSLFTSQSVYNLTRFILALEQSAEIFRKLLVNIIFIMNIQQLCRHFDSHSIHFISLYYLKGYLIPFLSQVFPLLTFVNSTHSYTFKLCRHFISLPICSILFHIISSSWKIFNTSLSHIFFKGFL